MTVDEWDSRWNEFFEISFYAGRSQTEAIEIAYRETELEFGPRPEGRP